MLPGFDYKNFVKASNSTSSTPDTVQPKYYVSGQEARRIYLNEVKDASTSSKKSSSPLDNHNYSKKPRKEKVQLTKKDYFVAAQTNDVETLKNGLKYQPEMLNAIDEFGWSLLMIACQANSVQTVEELLKLGADISVQDKAGNSACNLVIKNKNLQIVDLLLNNKAEEHKSLTKIKENPNHTKKRMKDQEFTCEICSNIYPDKEQHLISTVHNINASKGKKVPPCYKLPETNKGFQIMLKTGWDKGSGLGYDGSGIQYPIRAVQKKDRKGLGHEGSKTKLVVSKADATLKQKSKKLLQSQRRRNKDIEINFRREFY